MKKATPAGRQGFTLIELVMAIVIAGIIIYPLLSVFITAAWRNADQEAAVMALYLANGKLEMVSSRGFDGINSESAAAFDSPFGDFNSTVTVHYVSAAAPDIPIDPATSEYKSVTVRVASAGGNFASVEVTTLATSRSNE